MRRPKNISEDPYKILRDRINRQETALIILYELLIDYFERNDHECQERLLRTSIQNIY